MRSESSRLLILATLLRQMACAQNVGEAKAEITTFTANETGVVALAITPDGRHALVGERLSGTVKLFDLATGKVAREFTSFAHSGELTDVAISPDGQVACSAGDNLTMHVWGLRSGKRIAELVHAERDRHIARQPLSIACSNGGRRVLSSGGGGIKVWDTATGRLLATFTHLSFVKTMQFLADDRRVLVAAAYDNTLHVIDAEDGKTLADFALPERRWLMPGNSILSAAIDTNGRLLLASTTFAGTPYVRLLDAETGEELRTFNRGLGVDAVAISPDGRLGIWEDRDGLALWQLSSGRALARVPGSPRDRPRDRTTRIVISSDGRVAVSGSIDGTIRVWQVDHIQARATASGEDIAADPVTRVAISADNKWAVVATATAGLGLWDLTRGELRWAFGSGNSTAIAISRDGQLALSGSPDHTLRLWDLDSRRSTKTIVGHTLPVTAIAFSPDGTKALSASEDRSVKLWDIVTGSEITTLVGHADKVTALAFTADGKRALTAGVDATLRVWDLATTKEIKKLSEPSWQPGAAAALSVSSDAKRGVVVSELLGLAILWNLDAGKIAKTVSAPSLAMTSGPFEHQLHSAAGAAFVNDDRAVLIGGASDGSLLFWDLARDESRILPGHNGPVAALAASASGTFAVSGGRDGTMRLWNARKSTEVARFSFQNGDAWVVMTPDGYFAGSPRMARDLAKRLGSASVPSTLPSSEARPDIILARLSGRVP